MYADTVTRSMKRAIEETNRRRAIQDAYNKTHGITPTTVIKGIRDVIRIAAEEDDSGTRRRTGAGKDKESRRMSVAERDRLVEMLTKEMKEAARRLEFEQAAFLRDRIRSLKERRVED